MKGHRVEKTWKDHIRMWNRKSVAKPFISEEGKETNLEKIIKGNNKWTTRAEQEHKANEEEKKAKTMVK